MKTLDRSGCFRMVVALNEALRHLKASTAAVFHARCLGSFFKRDTRGMARELKPQMNFW